MKRYGAVIVFRQSLTKAEAEDTIGYLVNCGYIDDPSTPAHTYDNGKVTIPAHSGVYEYDDLNGDCGPVWYLP